MYDPQDPKHTNIPSKIFRWLDKRTGVNKLMHDSLDEPIPGGARLAYVFGSGLLFIFISQIITGICLAIYYVPSAESAHASVAYITKQVAAGAFLRSLHYYGSSAMIIVLLLHFLQTFLYGSFKGRRELLWISGALLSFLVLGMGFTGYLLPWDQKAYFATAVGTNIVAQVPLIGNWLTRLLRGGDTLGTLTLSRFYVAHVFLIPAGIFLFVAAHIALFRKAGPAGPINEDPIEPKLPPQGFYPRQVIMDMAFAFLIMIGLGVLSFFHPASLGPVANPADTTFLPRPEWYYLPMFEWLKYWEGPKVVFAVVVIPGILAALFFLLPFLDRKFERRPWRRPIPVLAVAFVVVGMVYLGNKSRLDDQRDPTTAAQIATQDQQEKDYAAAPFEPFIESPGAISAPAATATDIAAHPQAAQGRGIFEAHGCSSCHGPAGVGTPIAKTLVGITTRIPDDQLITLLHAPNAKMIAGRMPAVDISPTDMSALVAYLAVLGTPAANIPAAFAPPALELANARTAPTQHLAADAAAGRRLFEARGCFACHGQSGSGGRTAPLATLIAGKNPTQLSALLIAPTAKMRAGAMQPVTASPTDLANLVAYLRTLSTPTQSASPMQSIASQSSDSVTTPQQSASTTASASPPPASAAAGSNQSSSPATAANTAANIPTRNPATNSAGTTLFVAQGCAACHGRGAEGTRFAPTLLAVNSKFPGDKLPTLLRHPTNAMRAKGMPPVTLNDAQLAQLVTYLNTFGATPAPNSRPGPQPTGAQSASTTQPNADGMYPTRNPQPAIPSPEVTARELAAIPLSPDAQLGQQVFQKYSCQTCHGTGGLHGTAAAPGLAGTASILPAAMLENLLRHHSLQMQRGGMPATHMSPQDMAHLVTYLRTLPSLAN